MTLPPLLRKPKTRTDGRVRSPKHLAWVRRHACCVPGCTATDIEAAHVRTLTDGGTGLKPGDNWAVSACAEHHRQQHALGETSFARRHGIDLHELAEEFARRSPDPVVRKNAGVRYGRS